MPAAFKEDGGDFVSAQLEKVATFRTPSGVQQGRYVLRQERWADLDLYHPRLTPRRGLLQLAEEQYALTHGGATAASHLLPRWQPASPSLAGLHRGLLCEELLQLTISAVMHNQRRTGRVSDTAAVRALHLLHLAVDAACCAVRGDAAMPSPALEAKAFFALFWRQGLLLAEDGKGGSKRKASPSRDPLGPPEWEDTALEVLVRLSRAGGADRANVERGGGAEGSGRRASGEERESDEAACAKALLAAVVEADVECRQQVALIQGGGNKDEGGGEQRTAAGAEARGAGAGKMEVDGEEEKESDMERRRRVGRERQAQMLAQMQRQQQAAAATLGMDRVKQREEAAATAPRDRATGGQSQAAAREGGSEAGGGVQGAGSTMVVVRGEPGLTLTGLDETSGAMEEVEEEEEEVHECALCKCPGHDSRMGTLGYVTFAQRTRLPALAGMAGRQWRRVVPQESTARSMCELPEAWEDLEEDSSMVIEA
ncbi:hypothetical protein CYMTET_31588, partial [Cymbomonas tetramitiformis]